MSENRWKPSMKQRIMEWAYNNMPKVFILISLFACIEAFLILYFVFHASKDAISYFCTAIFFGLSAFLCIRLDKKQ